MTASQTLVASCTNCGGTVAVRLLEETQTCGYCDHEVPLAPEVAARVAEVGARLRKQEARRRQLADADQRSGLGLPVVVIAVLWTLICGVYIAIAADEAVGGLQTIGFYLSDPPPAGTIDHPSYARGLWWLVYLNVTGIVVSTLMCAWSDYAGTWRVGRVLRPFAPIADDAPPRCRCCSADLAREGVVRRCSYCGSDHVVVGEAYREETASIEAALKEAEEARKLDLEKRQEEMEAGAYCPMFLPLPLVFVGWAAPMIPFGSVGWWSFTAVAALAVPVVWVLALRARGILASVPAVSPSEPSSSD